MFEGFEFPLTACLIQVGFLQTPSQITSVSDIVKKTLLSYFKIEVVDKEKTWFRVNLMLKINAFGQMAI